MEDQSGEVNATMKQKSHQFVLIVKTNSSRKSAEIKVLSAFAKRKPDNCEFHLKNFGSHKEIWMAGAKAGMETAFDAMSGSIANMRGKKNHK